VGVPLLTSSARVVTVLADAISLTPGSMVLQVDQDADVMYVYALGPRDRPAVERARRQAMDVQCRVLAAFGSAGQVAAARRWLAAHPAGEAAR
jgi:multicomponent Na+:H+ antiporter subunit E